MAEPTWGTVRGGVVVPDTPLPEGTRVEIVPPTEPLEFTPEEQAEFDAWEAASAHALELVERLAEEEPDEKG